MNLRKLTDLFPAAAFLAPAVVALVFACAAPGQPVSPQAGDFAFVEVDLRG